MQPSTSNLPSAKSAIAPATGDLEVLLFKLGARSLAVPLAHVLYVAKMPADFASRGGDVGHHFVFEGSPLTYVSLWDVLGQKSAYAEYEEMQTLLPQRKQDHLDWMAALEDSIRTGTPFSKARSPRECAFGKWFYGYRARDRRLSLLLAQFEHPHATIHALADRLLGVSEAGHVEDALHSFEEAENTTLAKLMELFVSAQELVVELQRRIALIVSDGETTCALGADSVLDIVTVPPERIKENSGRSSWTESRATSALLILEDSNVVPLLDWRKF